MSPYLALVWGHRPIISSDATVPCPFLARGVRLEIGHVTSRQGLCRLHTMSRCPLVFEKQGAPHESLIGVANRKHPDDASLSRTGLKFQRIRTRYFVLRITRAPQCWKPGRRTCSG